MTNSLKSTTWSSQWTFLLAAIGSAVGLGNIWKFPYITGENGGGAFVLVYLACILIIGVPVMICEVMLGRASKSNPVHGVSSLAKESNKSKYWGVLGLIGILTGLIILSFYSSVAGWALKYTYSVSAGVFNNTDASFVGNYFVSFLQNTDQLMQFHSVFILISGLIIALGVIRGLETAIKVFMPILFILLFILLFYSIAQGQFNKAVEFMFDTDFSKLNSDAILVAMGHAFFTLSLGMGAIMTYGSYMPEKPSITKTVLTIAFFDTLIAIVAGLIIFPLVFQNGLDPSSGPGLLFISLPIAFGNIPMGNIFGGLFFVLVCIAAWSSAISILEPGVAWLNRLGLKRVWATMILCFTAWLGGLACIYSNNWTSSSDTPWKAFEWMDHIASNISLPLGGLFISLFAGWKLSKQISHQQLSDMNASLFKTWQLLTKYVAPIGIVLILLNSSGLLKQLTAS